MSTSTIASRKSWGTSASASTTAVLREALDHALLVGVLVGDGRLELVVEEVVAFLERLRVGAALRAAAAVDVEVREDAQEPGAQVGAGLVLLPGAEGACVGVLDEVFGFLAGAGEPPGDTVDLVAQLERLFLEANTVTLNLRDAAGFGSCRGAFAHDGHPSNLF